MKQCAIDTWWKLKMFLAIFDRKWHKKKILTQICQSQIYDKHKICEYVTLILITGKKNSNFTIYLQKRRLFKEQYYNNIQYTERKF